MSNDPVIQVSNISKAYRIWSSPVARLTSPLLEMIGRSLPLRGTEAQRWLKGQAESAYRDFLALQDISFDLGRGESLGIIGRNGSGKSTLLQIIAGTLRPTVGTVETKGRVAALLELGSGFNPEFTGRENVYLNSAVLGLTRREVDARFDQIAAFADIGDYIEQPVKTYSSGMMVRLAFAVQTTVDPDILIIDEALAVGDVFFQQRCFDRMQKLLDRGTSIILVTHDPATVQRFCQRTLVLQRSRLVFAGPSAEATKIYFQLDQQERVAAFTSPGERVIPSLPPAAEAAGIPNWPGPSAWLPLGSACVVGNGWASCIALAVCDTNGEPRRLFQQGETMAVFYEFEIHHDMDFCVGCVTLRDKTTQAVHSKMTLQDGVRSPMRVTAGSRLRFRQDTVLNLACADYTLDVALEMVSSEILTQPGVTYDDFMRTQLRICELHGVAPVGVRLRTETVPFQLIHFGVAGMPSSSHLAVIPAS